MTAKELDLKRLCVEWNRALEENLKAGNNAWAVYVNMSGVIQARPQDDKFWALYIKTNAWGAQKKGDPERLVLDPNIKQQLINDYSAILY